MTWRLFKLILLYSAIAVGFTVISNLIIWLLNDGFIFDETYMSLSFILENLVYVFLVSHLFRFHSQQIGHLIRVKTVFIIVFSLAVVTPLINAIVSKLICPFWAEGYNDNLAAKEEYLKLINDPETFLLGVVAFFVGILILGLFSGILASRWIIFTKADKKGWYSIVPILSIVTLLEITKKPTWWILLYFIPIANIIIAIIVLNNVAKRFGKDDSFTAGLLLLPFIFYPILAFGNNIESSDDEVAQIGTE